MMEGQVKCTGLCRVIERLCFFFSKYNSTILKDFEQRSDRLAI
jgi:hypothetical protein